MSQGAPISPRSTGIEAENPDLSGRTPTQPLADFDGARLAGSVRSEDGRDLTGSCTERDSVDRGDRTFSSSVADGEIVHLHDVVDRPAHDPGSE